jgi:hypothetical protein
MKTSQRILIGLSMMSLIIGGGTASATYAWYQLNQDKTISVSGTSFGKGTNMEIGFVSDVDLSYEGLTYGQTDSTNEGKKIYWADNPSDVGSDIVKYVLDSNGYASDVLYPVTSGKYTKGNDFKLYSSPKQGWSFDEVANEKVDKLNYIHLTFAFKLSGGSNTTSNAGVVDSPIYLSDCQISGSIRNAVRMHIGSNSAETLINPSSSADYTYVGGALDLDQDGQFDTFTDSDGLAKEYFYGQNESALEYGDAYTDTVVSPSANVNCFVNPSHAKGVIPLKSTNSYYEFASKANYESMSDYIYQLSNGNTGTVSYISKTDSFGIAFLDIDVFAEGWDHSVINSEIGHNFGVSLTFTNGVSA